MTFSNTDRGKKFIIMVKENYYFRSVAKTPVMNAVTGISVVVLSISAKQLFGQLSESYLRSSVQRR
jgi:hypothetical protein